MNFGTVILNKRVRNNVSEGQGIVSEKDSTNMKSQIPCLYIENGERKCVFGSMLVAEGIFRDREREER